MRVLPDAGHPRRRHQKARGERRAHREHSPGRCAAPRIVCPIQFRQIRRDAPRLDHLCSLASPLLAERYR